MEQRYVAELRQRAVDLGIAHRVHFTGFVSDEDLYGLIAGCELVVHPALDEDFGLIVAAKNLSITTLDIDNILIARTIGFR